MTVFKNTVSTLRQALQTSSLESLLGVEGTAARRYFGAFSGVLKAGGAVAFTLEGRNKRPPKDPINALLSFGYAMLTREWTTALHTLVGLDPYLGFYHQPRHGKPALALDRKPRWPRPRGRELSAAFGPWPH